VEIIISGNGFLQYRVFFHQFRAAVFYKYVHSKPENVGSSPANNADGREKVLEKNDELVFLFFESLLSHY